jgi:hypothetical protein
MPRGRAESHFGAGAIASRAVAIDVGEGLSLRGKVSMPPDARGVILVPYISCVTWNLPYDAVAVTELGRTGFVALTLDLLARCPHNRALRRAADWFGRCLRPGDAPASVAERRLTASPR